MAITKIEPSGCGVHKGRVKLRIDLFMNPDDPHYDKHYVYVVDWNSPEAQKGYKGRVDELGTPKNQADFDAWVESLPHIWQNNPFHSHFIYPDKDATDADIKAEIERCLDYFYALHQYAWDNDKKFIDEWKKVPRIKGTIRDVFIKGNPKDLKKCQLKADDIKNRIAEFKIGKKIVPPTDLNIGDKGTIDVGSTAEDRGSSQLLYNEATSTYYTAIDYNNPSNANGSLDTVNAWFKDADAGNSVKVGTFVDNGSHNFTCHDAEEIGEVSPGENPPFTGLSIDISTGEYIGADSRGTVWLGLERTVAGGSGVYWIEGQYCDPTDTDTYAFLTGLLSLNGTGEEAVTFIPTVTII